MTPITKNMEKISVIATSPCPEGNYVTLVCSDNSRSSAPGAEQSSAISIIYLRAGDFNRLQSRGQLQDFPLVQSLAVS